MKTYGAAVFVYTLILLTSCSDDNDGNPSPEALVGHIIYEYTSDVKIVDLNDWTERIFFSYNAYSTNSWDLSKDGKLRLISERQPGTIKETRFKLVNVDDGSIAKEFDYFPESGTNQGYSGKLSFDASLILINPDFDNGIVILDTDGEVKHRLYGINDESLTLGDYACWLPGNSILIVFKDQYLLRSDPPYTTLNLVREMNYEQWGNIRVSTGGEKLSLRIGNHVYLMNVDGSDLTQVTDGDGTESMAEFSPDDRYLLIGADYVHAPASGMSNWRLKIIPADGKLYHLDESPEVIPVVISGSESPVKAGGPTFWRP